MLPSCSRCPGIENVPGRLALVILPFSQAAGISIGNRILLPGAFKGCPVHPGFLVFTHTVTS